MTKKRSNLAASVKPFDRLDELHSAAADAFCETVTDVLNSADCFRVSLSGGSTPKRLYELLSERDLPWDRIHWFWGDERNVPGDHSDSNARMVRQALLDQVPAPNENIHVVDVNVEDPGAAARAYEEMLRDHFKDQTFPQWDLVLLGMGDDAHTASLFPETTALSERSRWFVENWVEKFDAYRYTLTAPAINSARRSWFLVAGEAKKEALKHVWSDDLEPQTYPSQLIDATRWFVTRDAHPGHVSSTDK